MPGRKILCVLPTFTVPMLRLPGFYAQLAKISLRVWKFEDDATNEIGPKGAECRNRGEVLERTERQVVEHGNADRGAVGEKRELYSRPWFPRESARGRGNATGAWIGSR